ncbi:MAG: uL22 family ribosomal protein [Candidatus Shapirobacteria bacterium]|nr:uL22 family ribosomal protein [Candidatus Shapirobacteria bacterium]
MEVIAKSKYIRMSPKKMRLVAAAIAHLPVAKAEMILTKLNKRATRPLLLTLKQGKANAIKNFGLKEGTLVIKRLEIGKGPSYKRGRPVARGQWHPILKRTCHIMMVLEGEKEKEKKENKENKEKKEKKNRGSKS